MIDGARDGRLVAFVVVRLTALVLAVLVLGHYALTHVVTDVAETNSGFVLERWSQGLWIAWDSAMLLAALAHAGCGLWLMADERLPRGRGRRRLYAAGAGSLTVLASTGIAAIAVAALRT